MHWFTVLRWVWLIVLVMLFIAIVGWRQIHHASIKSGSTKLKRHRTTKEYLQAARRIVDSIPNERVHLPADGVLHHATSVAPTTASTMDDGMPRVPHHDDAHGNTLLEQRGTVGGNNKLEVGTHEDAHGIQELPKVDHEAIAMAKMVGIRGTRAEGVLRQGVAVEAADHYYPTIDGEFIIDENANKYPTIAEWSGKERGTYRGVQWKLLNKESPRVMLAENVLSPTERRSIINAANASLARSEVVHAPGTSGKNSVRTSFGMFLSWEDQKMAANLKIRNVVSSLMGISPKNIEATQILRYEPGQFYRAHPDYFGEGSEHLKRGGQRFATLLFWLNDVGADYGGETRFPNSKGPVPLSLHPIPGSGVMFYSMTGDGHVDPTSFHEAIPPTKGEKWVAVSWVRQHEFH